MKIKTLVATLAAGALALCLTKSASAQGYVNVNNYDSGLGIFLGDASTPADALNGTVFVELLGGASAGSLSGVIPAGFGSAINAITANNGGFADSTGAFFDVGAGPVSGVAAQTLGTFQFLAWTGSSTFASATSTFVSAIWTQVVGTASSAGPPPSAGAGVSLNISSLTPIHGLVSGNALVMTSVSAVPEPSTLALAGLGGFGMLMAMRRKKA